MNNQVVFFIFESGKEKIHNNLICETYDEFYELLKKQDENSKNNLYVSCNMLAQKSIISKTNNINTVENNDGYINAILNIKTNNSIFDIIKKVNDENKNLNILHITCVYNINIKQLTYIVVYKDIQNKENKFGIYNNVYNIKLYNKNNITLRTNNIFRLIETLYENNKKEEDMYSFIDAYLDKIILSKENNIKNKLTSLGCML